VGLLHLAALGKPGQRRGDRGTRQAALSATWPAVIGSRRRGASTAALVGAAGGPARGAGRGRRVCRTGALVAPGAVAAAPRAAAGAFAGPVPLVVAAAFDLVVVALSAFARRSLARGSLAGARRRRAGSSAASALRNRSVSPASWSSCCCICSRRRSITSGHILWVGVWRAIVQPNLSVLCRRNTITVRAIRRCNLGVTSRASARSAAPSSRRPRRCGHYHRRLRAGLSGITRAGRRLAHWSATSGPYGVDAMRIASTRDRHTPRGADLSLACRRWPALRGRPPPVDPSVTRSGGGAASPWHLCRCPDRGHNSRRDHRGARDLAS